MGIIVSFGYMFSLIIISKLMNAKQIEYSRKFVHILSSNWWLISMYYFEEVWQPLFITCCFLIVNLINYKFQLPIFSSIKRKNRQEFGEISYSLSMILLVIISYHLGDLLIGFVGCFVMGYGDGLAAVIGTKFPHGRYEVFNNNRTLSGSLTMCIVAIIILCVASYLKIGSIDIAKIVLSAMLITLVEAVSVYGLDNLGVPLAAITGYLWVINRI